MRKITRSELKTINNKDAQDNTLSSLSSLSILANLWYEK
jgi:hypothetical protein